MVNLCYHKVMLTTQPSTTPKPQATKPQLKLAPKKPQPPSSRAWFMVMAMLGLMAVLMGFNLLEQPTESAQYLPLSTPLSTVMVSIDNAPTVSPLAANQATQAKHHVGIVAGHKGNDSGAICDDGFTEGTVNYTVATEVVSLLNRRGITTDLLDEFDDRLSGYQADALVSIHADSCAVPGASGFKVASVTESAIPDAEERLVACIYQEYGRYTNMPTHPGSITDNMTNYHAFREIDRQTPGAIIELGFLLDDRLMLERKPKILARGVAAGILCFLGE